MIRAKIAGSPLLKRESHKMNRQTLFCTIVSISVFFLSACGAAVPVATPTADYASEAKAAMQKYNDAVLKMDAETIASLFAEDGESWDNARLLARGPDEIRQFLKTFDSVVRVDSYETTVDSDRIEGDHVILKGTYDQHYTLLANNKSAIAKGSYEADWVRQPNGSWLVQKMTTIE
jgi:ketosteroid isomerase-like protein